MEYKAYSFDLDDNLLHLPSTIYLKDNEGKIIELSTLEFEKIRDRLEDEGLHIFEDSFANFETDEKFLKDLESSEKAGSWENLVQCIVDHASIFAIITARGHSPDAIREGIKRSILKYLDPEQIQEFVKRFSERYGDTGGKSSEEVLESYLDLCKFYPVGHKEIREKFGSENASQLKSHAFAEFEHYIKEHVRENFGEDTIVKIGFSDDSILHLSKMVNDILKKHGLFFYHTKKKRTDFL